MDLRKSLAASALLSIITTTIAGAMLGNTFEVQAVPTAHATGQCVDSVKMSIDFLVTKNLGNGNLAERVFLGDSGQSVSGGQFFDLISAGQTIVDANRTVDVPGISVQRGSGFVKVLLYGFHPSQSPNHLEAVLGQIQLQNATITQIQNDGTFPMENQGNGTFDFTDATSDDEAFLNGRFYLSVSTHADGFTVFYESNGPVQPNCNPTQCSDGQDNDGDNLIDFPADPGCESREDNDERNGELCPVPVDRYAVRILSHTPTNDGENPNRVLGAPDSSGVDFDNNGAQHGFVKVELGVPAKRVRLHIQDFHSGEPQESFFVELDGRDVGIRHVPTGGFVGNRVTFDFTATQVGLTSFTTMRILNDVNTPAHVHEGPDIDAFNVLEAACPTPKPQCRDGIDNDGDGATDHPNDFSCSSPDDDDEANPKAQCQDGIDNDGDGKIDFPADPGCTSKQDNDESNDVPPIGECVNRVSLQDSYGMLKARNGVYFHRTVHKIDLNDWFSVKDNQPWGSQEITDIDLTEIPKGLANPTVPVGLLAVGSDAYIHHNLLDLSNNNWQSFNLSKPWGSTAISNVGISGHPNDATLRAVIAVGDRVFYFTNENNPAFGQRDAWVDLSDNKPWGTTPITDIDVQSEGRVIVLAGNATYTNNLSSPNKWFPAGQPSNLPGAQPPAGGISRIDWDWRPVIGAQGSNVFYTSYNNYFVFSDVNDNKPWGGSTVDDVSVFFWLQEDPWGTPAIVLIVAGQKPYLHWHPENIALGGPHTDWEDTSDNAPWLARGGECSTQPAFQCNDGLDNDGDGKVDFPADPGCSSLSDDDERDIPQCRDGKDNDGDGAIDFPQDFSCSSPDDDDEGNPKAQCQDGTDNDGDGKIDARDPGCHSDGNADNASSYNPQDNDERDSGAGQVTVDKTGPASADRGSEVTYTIRAENRGTSPVIDTIITDIFPEDKLLYKPDKSTAGCTVSGGTIRCEIGTLHAGAVKTFTHVFSIKETSACDSNIENKADLQGRSGLLVWDTHSVTVTCGSPDPNNITIDLRDLKDPVEPNQTFNYEIKLNSLNTKELKGLTVTQSLDGQTKFVSATDGGTETSGVIKWVNVTVPGNGQTTLQATVRVDADADDGDVLNSTAFSGSKSDSETTLVREDGGDDGGGDNLTISVIDSPDPVQPLEILQYRIRLCNERSSDRTVDVTAFLDPDTLFLDASDGGDEDGREEVQWKKIRIGSDDCKELNLDVEVSDRVFDDDRLRLRVRADSEEDTEFTTVLEDIPSPHCRPPRPCPPPPGGGLASVSVDKRASRREAKPGDIVTYTVTVQNASDALARDVILEDRFTAGSIAITDAGGGNVIGSGIEWTEFDLTPDETRVFTYQARVGTEMRHGEVILNSVSVRGPDLERGSTDVEEVRIVTTLPQTGLGGFFSGWKENNLNLSGKSRHLFLEANGEDSTLPFILWTTVTILGIASGGLMGRRFIP